MKNPIEEALSYSKVMLSLPGNNPLKVKDSPDRRKIVRRMEATISAERAGFLPVDGWCPACMHDLVDHYQKTGFVLATGCPACHRSFVE